MANTKGKFSPRTPRTLARDLTIGQSFEKSEEEEKIRVLHELCVTRPTPHVHVVTNVSSYCFGFKAVV